jgi:hypothetical protein
MGSKIEDGLTVGVLDGKIRATLHQEGDCLWLVAPSGIHDGSISCVVLRVDACANVEQEADDVVVTPFSGDMEGCRALRGGLVDVCPLLL